MQSYGVDTDDLSVVEDRRERELEVSTQKPRSQAWQDVYAQFGECQVSEVTGANEYRG